VASHFLGRNAAFRMVVMLVRPLRSRACLTLQAVALAAYALAAVGGYGLHGLVDHGHVSACCGHGLECCQANSAHSIANEPSHDEPSYDGFSFAQSADDCSICSFLAQAQSSHVADVAPSGCDSLADVSLLVDGLVHSLPAAALQARGPPRA
jgi:hypothetical protein